MENLLPERGEAYLLPGLFPRAEGDELFLRLQREVPWRQEPIRIFGREVMQPRLTAWYAGPGVRYGYSGIELRGEPWSPLLLGIKARAEEVSGQAFNGALLNYYRDGQDSMGWHRDDEPGLGARPVIASVNFGATRVFRMRLKADKKVIRSVPLEHGSLLLMRGEMQHAWEHALPKTARPSGPRINLTFRTLLL
jgi:alkylated DNA repair dioxygenase AlkB